MQPVINAPRPKYCPLGLPFGEGEGATYSAAVKTRQTFCLLLLLSPYISAASYNESLNHLCAHIATVYLLLALRTQWGFDAFRKKINPGESNLISRQKEN